MNIMTDSGMKAIRHSDTHDATQPQGEIVLYQPDETVRLEVRLEDDTVWLTQQQMTELFNATKQNISLHIKNIFAEGELAEESTVKDYLTVRKEGNRTVQRRVHAYNLVTTDMAMNVNGQDIIAKETAHKHREGSKMVRRWFGDDSKLIRSAALRVFFLLLMAVGSVVNEAWAANSVYIIINGQGERVTNWQYNGKGIPDKLKSPYATNYRYYESLTDAQADASNNITTNAITDVNTLVTTDKTYYVRYDYQAYSGSATALDLTGGTWYNIKAGTKYMYVNTGDASLPIASTIDGGGIGLNSYKWKLYAVPDKQGHPDPYNIKISNREVDKTQTDYVLTGVKPAGQTELQKANNKAAPLSCQVDGTTANAGMSFQRFILTQASGKTTWQLIAAYEYPEKDGSPQYYNGGDAHTQQHHYIHDDNPVSASRVWNCQHNDNDSQLTITVATASTTTFHLINLGTDGVGTSGRREVISYQALNDGTLTASLRADFRSPLVSEFQYYGASAVSTDASGNYTINTGSSDKWTEGATLGSDVDDVYVTYTYDASTAALKLDGSRATLIKNQSRHLCARDNISGNGGGGGDRTDYNAGIDDATLKSDLHYQWLLKGNDPYNVRLYSYYYETDTYGYYLCRKGDVYTFIVKDGNSFTTEVDHYALMPTTADTNDNGDYELMAIQPDGAAYIDGNYRYLRFSSDYPRHDTKASAEVVQTDLQQLAPPVTYHLVNLGDNGQGTSNRKEVISVISTTGTVSLPATLRSPLATNFRYYRAEAFASTSGTSAFLNPSSTYELTENTDVPAGVTDIYVTYEYNAATAAVKLDKVSQYNIRINSALYCVDRKNNSNAALTGDMDTDWSTYAWDESTLTSNGYTLAEQNGRWLLAGNDPYNIKIYSVKDPKYHLSMYNSEPYARLFREGQTSQTLDITSFAIFANSTGGYEMLALKPDGTPYGNGTNYYLGANNNNLVRLSNFTDAARKMEFLPFVTYAIVRQGTTDAPVETVVVSYVADQTLSLPNRTKFQRVGCTLSTKYYRDRACTQEITSMSADATTVYIPYTFNSTDAERTALANTGMVFSTESDPVWLNLIVNNRFETYDSSHNQLRTDNGSNLNKVSDYDYVNPAAQFAFIGDPYAFKVYSRSSSKYAYLDGTANETTVSGTVRFADAPSDELSTWAIIPGYKSSTTFQVMLNGHSNVSTRAFWNPSGGGTPIVMWTVENRSDNNAWVVPIRNLDYQWHIVNKQNSLLSKLTAKSDAATTLWSTFPGVLKSPMIADSESNYKFFNTQAEAYAYTTDGTATGAITTWGDVTGTDIYVGYRYNPDNAPDGSLDLSGDTWYLVYYNKSESTQCYAIRSFDNSTGNLHNYYHWRSNASPQTKLDKIDCFLWKLTGDDPYGFQMTNKSSNSTLRFNKTATSWYINSSYPDDGNDRFFLHKDASGNWNIGQVSPNYNTGEWNYIRWLGTNDKDNDSNNLQLQANDTNANNIYESDRAYQDLTIETFKLNYTYNIVDNEGRIAIKYTERQEVGQTLGYNSIPEAIRSPYIEDETLTFYDTFTENDLSTLAGLLTITPSVPDANIYVRYTTDRLSAKPLHLTGSRSFKMQVNGDYINNHGGSFTHQNTDPGDQTSSFLWNVLGNDPYAVKVRNVGDNTKFFTYNTTTPALTLAADGDDTRFILMRHTSATNPAETELMAATGADLAVANYYSVGRTTGDNDVSVFANTKYEHGYDQLTVLLTPVVLDITYRVIDKQNKIVLEVPADNPELGLPAEWKSPLVAADGYHYWAESNFTKTGNTYTLREAQTEISSTSASTDGYIYVTYDVITDADDANYVDLNPDVTDYKERVRRVANDTSTPMVRNAANFGTMYMLEFLNGVPDYLENGGDEVETFTTKPVYPYNNGDGQMYIYGSDRWNTQSTAGASTRTRWPWYLLAVNNDPYHVMVTSWQNTHARAENGTTTNYYGFLRTYYNTTINQVITTTVSDDPKETTDATHGDPSAVPTEYMLLGQKDAYKLMTTEEVNGSHQTVNSFEQYWKTYETVTSKNTYTLPAMNPNLSHAQDAGTLHSYGAWVNARPDIGGGSRSFEYRNHWYQTISMGDGTFKLNPTEIDAVLVLTDNHGWEVMRHPIAKYSETTKYESVKQFLRKYDSPMVSQYRFYGYRTAPKMPGYHKYTLAEGDLAGTASSLAAYPEKYNGGALVDLYVSYDVKPEYADAYTGAATEAATSVNYPFLIRQDGHLAKTDNGKDIAFEDATATIDANDVSSLGENDHPELYWYLKPNFDIDTEMGYEYDVEDENHQVISKEATNAAYHTDGKSGFDPYNIQIYNKQYTSAYFTTDASAAGTENHQYMVTTTPAGNGRLSLGGTPSEKFTTLIPDYDSRTLHITNATFMAVQDVNGNMRLMPRFDHSHVVSDFGTLVTPADARPADDKEHSQTTWLLRPDIYTYVIVDNEGREALRYQTISTGAPSIPTQFCSPLATNFKYYKEVTLENEITTSYSEATGITDKTVYVHYDYNREADTQGLLQGTWLTTQLNGTDVQYNGGITTGTKNAANAAWQWRLLHSSGDTPDPYAVKLYTNADGLTNPMGTSTLAGGSVTASASATYPRFVLLSHKGTPNAYALAVAGAQDAANYYFLNGTSWPATTTLESGYASAINLSSALSSDATKLTFTADITPTNIRYKIVTLSGQIALTGDSLALASGKPSMPYYMRSPMMSQADDTYSYYAGVSESGGKYTAVNPTTTLNNLDVEDGKSVVYVRYDYDKSRKAVTYFGGLVNNYITDAPLDLSGQVSYVLSLGGGHIWQQVNTSSDQVTLRSNGDDMYRESDRWRKRSLWLLKGNDPYEVQFVNPEYSSTKVFASQEASTANTITNDDMTHKIATKMVEPDDTDYPYQTFMILKGANNNDPLKLFVTGHDDMFISESGSLYAWKDRLNYKARTDKKSEPTSRGNGQYIRFGYRPNIVFHVITNDGQEAVWANSVRASEYNKTEFRLPEYVQSPLLTATDYRYYTKATWDGSKWTVDESSLVPSTITTAAQAAAERIGEVWVRYTYDPETSPYMIASDIDDSNEMRVNFTNAKGLDLSGNTWYNMSAMQSDWGTKHGKVLGFDSGNKMQQQDVSTAKHGVSNKKFLWRMEGNDPYAIRLVNASEIDKCLSINSGNNIEMATYGTSGLRFQTFMLLNAVGTDNEEGDFKDGYPLRRWSALFGTGTEYASSTYSGGNLQIFGMIPLAYTTPSATTSTNYPNGLRATNIRMTGDDGDESKQNFPALMFNGIGSTAIYCLEFTKAPVSRKYHYHAYNTEKREWTWDVILEHDFLAPLVLEDQIARLYSKYEQEYLTSGATTAGIFKTRTELEALNNAQFYSNEAMTERVYDSNSATYDIYPEIGEDDVCDIYFKYQPMTNSEIAALTGTEETNFRWSTEEQITADVATHQANHSLYGTEDDGTTPLMKASWQFMVLDTDAAFTNSSDDTTVGKQYFLRHEDDGTVAWMNNGYQLYADQKGDNGRTLDDDTTAPSRNYKQWSYNRVAEYFKDGENEEFREGRWLWAFTGDPYNLNVVNFEARAGIVATSEGAYHLAPDAATVTAYRDSISDESHTYPVMTRTELAAIAATPTSTEASTTEAAIAKRGSWGLAVGSTKYPGEATFALVSNSAYRLADTDDPDQLYWQMTTPASGTGHVQLALRTTDRTNAIRTLPYEPMAYQDVVLTIRRMDDCVQDADGTKGTGTKAVYYAQEDRMFCEGDVIDNGGDKFPTQARRQFCNYKFYTDQFVTPGTEYTVWDASRLNVNDISTNPNTSELEAQGRYLEKAKRIGGSERWMQSVYVGYEVTTDMFITPGNEPTNTTLFATEEEQEAELERMIRENDHVYFMDFPGASWTYGNVRHDYTAHAYYRADAAKDVFKDYTGHATGDNLTHHYHTDPDRMYSQPENLKWYFVGDPYNLQVFCARPDLLGQNLSRIIQHTIKPGNVTAVDDGGANTPDNSGIHPGCTQWQFVHDCVQLHPQNDETLDDRMYLARRNKQTGELEYYPNPNRTHRLYTKFHWEVMCPATGDDERDTKEFALRYVDEETQLSYRGVYYYLHHGYDKSYTEEVEGQDLTWKYQVDLKYDAGNATVMEKSKYIGYHTANEAGCAIRLVQPARVYIDVHANNATDSQGNTLSDPVVHDELTEYFGVGETLTDMPAHLKREFATYNNLHFRNGADNLSSNTLTLTLDPSSAVSHGNTAVKEHTCLSGYTDNYVFKLDVNYSPQDGIFSTYDQSSGELTAPKWFDIRVANRWLYYDVNGALSKVASSESTQKQVVSKYNGNTPIRSKGYHWALVGDPYSLKVVNRRIYEDALLTDNTENEGWLTMAASTSAIGKYASGTQYLKMGAYAEAEDFAFQQSRTYYRQQSNGVETVRPVTDADGNPVYDIFLRIDDKKSTGYSTDDGTTKSDETTDLDATTYDANHWNATNDYSFIYMLDERTNMGQNGDGAYRYDFTRLGDYAWFIQRQHTLYVEPNTNQNYDRYTSASDIKSAYVRTVDDDHDEIENDCFDAHIRVYNTDGQLMHETSQIEVRYTDLARGITFDKVIPAEVKRFGCTYRAYLTCNVSGTKASAFADEITASTEVTQNFLDGHWTAAKTTGEANQRRHVDIYLTYTVSDNVTVDGTAGVNFAAFFTDQMAAARDEYAWVNSYYGWKETYRVSGSTVTIPVEVPDYDSPILNEDGLIVGYKTKTTYQTIEQGGTANNVDVRGYLNVKTTGDDRATGAGRAFGDERQRYDDGTNNDPNRASDQKWAFVGDPYNFELKNYALYQTDGAATTLTGSSPLTTSTTATTATHWTLKVGSDGTPYLALLSDDTNREVGTIVSYATFDRARNGQDLVWTRQFLYLTGGETVDPTGQAMNANGAHPFYLVALNSYASVLVYHLIIGHQHQQYNVSGLSSVTGIDGADNPNGLTTEQLATLQKHIDEIAHYNTLRTNAGGASVKATSLRDIVSYPIEDYSVTRVGVGNALTVPWYMRRQFCKYQFYQMKVEERVKITQGETAADNGVEDYTDSKALHDSNTNAYLLDAAGKRYYYVWKQVKDTDDNSDGTNDREAHDDTKVTKVEPWFQDRKVTIAVVYDVDEQQFRFSDIGRRTTAWYTMLNKHTETVDVTDDEGHTMTLDHPMAGLMNFSYKDGIGARLDRSVHYTNNYLWAPVGDPYGFVLHNRYATVNGTGWRNIVVTTPDWLPTREWVTNGTQNWFSDEGYSPFQLGDLTKQNLKANGQKLTYTNATDHGISFYEGRVVHQHRTTGRDTDGANNAVYEMMTTNSNTDGTFLMHPTADYINPKDANFNGFYVTHTIDEHKNHELVLTLMDAATARNNDEANWKLETTPEQLLPYFQRSGYVGGLKPEIAATSTAQAYQTQLEQYVTGGSLYGQTPPFALLDNARKLVYSGKFLDNNGQWIIYDPERDNLYYANADGTINTGLGVSGYVATDIDEASDVLKGSFCSNNLQPLEQGYYRIEAFSREALDADGNDLKGDGSGLKGITGPRFISGYRHLTEQTCTENATHAGTGRWLHFYETDEANRTISTFAELQDKISASNDADRSLLDHPAMAGNIDIPAAEYDAATIFHFNPVEGDPYQRWTFATQGLTVAGYPDVEGPSAAESGNGYTRMISPTETPAATDNTKFRIDDIGGTAVTIRSLDAEYDSDKSSTWRTDVGKNIQTNYLCIDAHHRYRITMHTDNEMKEIGDHASHGYHGIQDTKWMLKPVQDRATADPFRHDMPLRLELFKGGVKDEDLEQVEGNYDDNYYASLYVPFDSRLTQTTANAFTYTGPATPGETMNMKSLSTLTDMGNGQYIPAEWPVIVRSTRPTIVGNDATDHAKDVSHGSGSNKYYVELFIPDSRPNDAISGYDAVGGKLSGKYLEQDLGAIASGHRIMVFGLPMQGTGSGDSFTPVSSFAHDYTKRVGVYRNYNWAREQYPNANAHGTGVATAEQRKESYVLANKAYFDYDTTSPSPAPARHYIPMRFDDDDLPPSDPDGDAADTTDTSHITGVYDLAGRLVRSRESVLNGTWRRNLPPGMYIVNGRQVTVGR